MFRFNTHHHQSIQVLILKVVFLILYTSANVNSSIRSIELDIKEKIDDFIETFYLPESNITTLGLTIVQNDDKLLYTTGYGYANQEKRILNTNKTQFLLGSITKSFTALVFIKALSEKWPEMGELVLDTPIIKLLPDSNFTLVDRFRTEHVTFRDLLAHRLCVIRDDLQLQAEPFDTVEEIVFRIRYAEDVCGLRTSQVYNNQMFIALSLLVRQITGRSYEDMGYELLNEIGMFNSAFIAKADDFPNMSNRAQPYYVVDNVAYPTNPELIKRVAPTTIAAGGLFTTPNDMARYLRLHLNLGKIDGKQIIPKEVMLWTRESSIHFPYSDFKTSDNDITMNTLSYGLALRLGIYDGWEHINHGGYFPPYKSLISMFPALKLGIFTSTNQAPSLVDQTVLHSFIFETLRGNENARKVAEMVYKKEQRRHLDEVNSKKKQLGAFLRASEKEGFHPSPNEIIGRYGNGLSGELEIFFKFNHNTNGTGLYLSYGKWLKGWLEITDNYGVYNLIWDSDIVHDDYAWGLSGGRSMYVSVKAGKIDLITITPYGELFRGQFEKEFRFDKLPIIPWNSENCSN